MILCAIADVEPGSVLGASVLNPRSPETQLLKPGVVLDGTILRRMAEIGVKQVWVEDTFSNDLDLAVAPDLEATKVVIYSALKEDLLAVARRTITTANVLKFKQTIVEMVMQLMSHSRYTNMVDSIFQADRNIFTHGTNVAYLSLITGLELQPYIMRERARLDPEHAKDLSSMGIGALLHDVGKLQMGSTVERFHEICGGVNDPRKRIGNAPEGYKDHTRSGHKLLRHALIPATTSQIVLNHHQRFDGTGWPEVLKPTPQSQVSLKTSKHQPASKAVTAGANDQVITSGDDDAENVQKGSGIHILVRIVSAANVLDNLLYDGECSGRPPIAALCEFASPKFNGWFDPVVRAGLLRRVPPFAVGSLVKLDDDKKAVVVAPNTQDPCRPAVRLIGEDIALEDTLIDLNFVKQRRIVEYLGVDIDHWQYTIPDTGRFKKDVA